MKHVRVGPFDAAPPWSGRCLAWALVAATGPLAGCSHVLLHDERRDQQGQEAKRLVAEARIGDTVAALEKSFADVAALEEARARDRAAYLFDSELKLVSRAPSLTSRFSEEPRQVDGLRTAVERRLMSIGMTDKSADGLKELRKAEVQHKQREQALQATLIEFHGTVGHRFDGCQSIRSAVDTQPGSETLTEAFLAGLPEKSRATARLKFPALIDVCTELDAAAKARGAFVSAGIVAQIYGELDRLQLESARYEKEVKGARDSVEQAAKALRDSGAEAAATPAAPGKLEAVESRAKGLADTVRLLSDGVGILGEGGAHAAAAEKLSRLEAVLGLVAGLPPQGEITLTRDERVAVAVVRSIPALADEADLLLTQARKPRLVPFLAAIDQQKLVLAGFEAGRDAKRKQESAVRAQLAAVQNEAVELARVLDALTKGGDAWASSSLGQLLGSLDPQEKLNLLRALSIYADDVKAYRIEAAAWKARADAAKAEEGLARSRFAAAQWDALADTIATVLADYHAAGIKQADLAEFFKALGLVTIGVGVAQ